MSPFEIQRRYVYAVIDILVSNSRILYSETIENVSHLAAFSPCGKNREAQNSGGKILLAPL
jgi:hypothetical protein